ncbi:hypothetical protein [Pseudomonas phage Nerthus]|uniref:DNMP kinase n=1 Tax=Pseudomonas phage Nerthus TaxID=2163984 RepID=A0A2S1GMP8_9CAUD|nr:hypothetical protein HOT09_gp23 [Pseudomonas phage Nerthus]AWD90655.1 hypothetical protein [Pseudomonas phage Nerthus]
MTTIIGMNGAKRSGKDFGATILIDELVRRNYTVHRTSFAKALRQCAVAVSGCDPKDIDDNKDRLSVYRISLTGLRIWLRQRGLLPERATDKFMEGWAAAIKDELKLQRKQAKHAIEFFADEDGWEMAGSGRDLLIVLGQAARQLDPLFWIARLQEEVAACGATVVVVTDVRPQNEACACNIVIEVSSSNAEFEGTATESRLPDHLVTYRVFNALDKTYGSLIRTLIPNIIRTLEA